MTPAAHTPAIIYCRVSTREQGDSRLGLDAQEEACRSEAGKRGWNIVRVVHEVVSGERDSRPLFNEACELAREHGGVLLASRVDRVSRGGPMKVLPLYERAGKEGWAVYALDMPEIDTTTGMGEFVLTIIAAVNRLERRMIGERTKAALARAKANGKHIGRPRSMDDDTLERLRALRAQGLSYRRIATKLNEDGVPGPRGGFWDYPRVFRALKRYGATATTTNGRK